MIIIQIFSKTPRAKREVLKNEKCTWSSRDCICSNFYFTNHLLNVSLKRKSNNILHHHMAYDCRKGSKSHWYTMARCWFTTNKPFFPPRIFTNPGLLLTNVPIYDKLHASFSGHQAFQTPAFNDRWPIQTSKVIDTYCCSISTALALSAVEIRHMMMEMLSVFLFSEAFSK